MRYIGLLSMTANLANESNGMSDDLKGAIITALVTGMISIIGFIVTNASMKKNFKNELKWQRDSIALEKMSMMPYEVLVLMDEMIESGKIKKVTIGVFENNLSARMCYKKVGFIEKEIVQGEQWNIIEMEILRTNYSEE